MTCPKRSLWATPTARAWAPPSEQPNTMRWSRSSETPNSSSAQAGSSLTKNRSWRA